MLIVTVFEGRTMLKTPTSVKQEKIRHFLFGKGYIEYAPGCFAKTRPGRPIAEGFYRYKFSPMSLKIEAWYDGSTTSFKGWVEKRKYSWREVALTPDGTKLCKVAVKD